MINYGKIIAERYTAMLTAGDHEEHEANKFRRKWNLKNSIDKRLYPSDRRDNR